ncbi:hypothetical protein [Lonsdalea britannica]|uniref:hypothetical protein n=1 Tax=Lonsdalea britannica TaxID=1082704 RepID=UPI0026F14FB4|nr:hypothetical protein [Lonsdalea britannica]
MKYVIFYLIKSWYYTSPADGKNGAFAANGYHQLLRLQQWASMALSYHYWRWDKLRPSSSQP